MANNPNAQQNLTPFQPGVTGNKNGRPKGTLSQFLREYGDAVELIFTIEKTDPKGITTKSTARLGTGEFTMAQATAAKLWQMALNGDHKAIQIIANRTEGRVPHPIVINTGSRDGAELNAWTADEVDRYEQWQAMMAQAATTIINQDAETVDFEDIDTGEQPDTNAD